MARKKVTFEVKASSKIFEDPQFGLRNLLSCVFHMERNMHLVDPAINLLNYIKANNGLNSSDWKKFVTETTPHLILTINGVQYTYSNYETILQNLRSIGMLRKEKGVYRLNKDFADYFDDVSDAWRRFLRS